MGPAGKGRELGTTDLGGISLQALSPLSGRTICAAGVQQGLVVLNLGLLNHTFR